MLSAMPPTTFFLLGNCGLEFFKATELLTPGVKNAVEGVLGYINSG